MTLNHYKFSASHDFLDFEFESDGRNGRIRKVVRFSPQNANGVTYFNLGFGDINSKTGSINDLSISSNLDTNKILATVAETVVVFTSCFPDAIVYAKGSTTSRTRLYQMGIASNWEAIELVLDVYGFINGRWEPFKKITNYEAPAPGRAPPPRSRAVAPHHPHPDATAVRKGATASAVGRGGSGG